MAAAHASVADVRPWQLDLPTSFGAQAELSKYCFPQSCLMTAIIFPTQNGWSSSHCRFEILNQSFDEYEFGMVGCRWQVEPTHWTNTKLKYRASQCVIREVLIRAEMNPDLSNPSSNQVIAGGVVGGWVGGGSVRNAQNAACFEPRWIPKLTFCVVQIHG